MQLTWQLATAAIALWLCSIALIWAVVRGGTARKALPPGKSTAARPDTIADADASATAEGKPRTIEGRLDALADRLEQLRDALDEHRESTNRRFLTRAKRDERDRRDGAAPETDPDREELGQLTLPALAPAGGFPASSRRVANGRARLIKRG